MATKSVARPDEVVKPRARFPYHSDQYKFGRILALLLTQYSSKDTRGDASVRFDVYPMEAERMGNKTLSVYPSRIYVQRDVDKDDTLANRPYLLVEETVSGADMQPFLDVFSISVAKVEIDGKGRPQRHAPTMVSFAALHEVAHDAYEFLVGM